MICKYLGDHQPKELNNDVIYRDRGGHISVKLCYSHSWELFRVGQKKFLSRYQDNFMQVFGTETEVELMEHMKGSKNAFQAWAA